MLGGLHPLCSRDVSSYHQLVVLMLMGCWVQASDLELRCLKNLHWRLGPYCCAR